MAAFIASQREQHGVPRAVSCRALGVSQSWFYKWKNGRLPPRAARRLRLEAEVARLFAVREGKDGAPRIAAAPREAGWRVSENTVAAVMAGQGLAARPGRKGRKHTTRRGKGRWRAPDLVGRDFPAAGINRKWYGDGTEIATGEGKLYLDSVLDMGSRRILGHALGEHHDADLAYGALVMAAVVRGGRVAGVIFHSDQGSEGGFNRSSQRLHVEVGEWGDRGDWWLPGRGDRRCVRRGGLRWPGENTGSGSGWRSPGECQVRTPALRLVCPRWLARAGSATAGGSGRSAWPRCRGGTCRSRSGRRSRSCAPGDAASARSPGVWVGRRQRSRGSCAGTLRPGAAGWSTGPRRPSGTRTGGHAARRSRNSLPARPCGSTCKTGSPARSPGWMARLCRAQMCAGSDVGTVAGRIGAGLARRAAVPRRPRRSR